MNSNYEVHITSVAKTELLKIYNYIAYNLYAKDAAENLINKISEKVELLRNFPYIFAEVYDVYKRKTHYRRIVVKKYVILYSIDEDKKSVFIVHIYYGGSNYL